MLSAACNATDNGYASISDKGERRAVSLQRLLTFSIFERVGMSGLKVLDGIH